MPKLSTIQLELQEFTNAVEAYRSANNLLSPELLQAITHLEICNHLLNQTDLLLQKYKSRKETIKDSKV